MSSKLNELIAKLNQTAAYTGLTADQIQEQANRRYQSVYDQKRLSAQQSYETGDAALARELASLQASYDQQREESKAATRQTYSQADRQALSRGMQRSSYNSATLANIDLAGDEALQEIGEAQTKEEGDIGQQRTQLSQQLARQLSQYDADQMNDVLSYMDELEAREFDRVTASRNTMNDLAMKIYEYQHQLEQEAIEQKRWEMEFEAKYGDDEEKESKGSSGKRSSSSSKVKTYVHFS